jgi:hypothetical protein
MSRVMTFPDPLIIARGRGRLLAPALLALAVVCAGVSAAAWSIDRRRVLFAYLTAWVFVASLSAGALAWLMLQHLTGAVWSVAVRRVLENLTRPLALIAIGFIPIALNFTGIYPWADPARLASDAELARKAVWLNPLFFLARSASYLVLWATIAGILRKHSIRQDQTHDASLPGRMTTTSAWGLVVLALTTSYAAFDWMMSLDPHWVSTIFGVYFWTGALLGSLAAVTLTVLWLRALGLLRHTITIEHVHDLGKLIFSFVVFWAYIAFSQYFLIWYANLPEEVGWYVTRRSGSWNTLSWGLFFGHFLVPFVILLSRAVRRDPFWMGFMAAWVLAFHYLDLYWLIMPAAYPVGSGPEWIDASVLFAVISLFVAIVAHACRLRPLVPVGDPRLADSIAFHQP